MLMREGGSAIDLEGMRGPRHLLLLPMRRAVRCSGTEERGEVGAVAFQIE